MRIIGGEAKGRSIDAPPGRNTRPTLDRIRENMFNILQADVPGSRVLDLFAGSGALSLEALSRGAENAVLTDHDRKAAETERKNIEKLRYEDRTRVLQCDWKKAAETLKNEKAKFDLVFLDPPYAMTDLRNVFSSLIPLIHNDTLVVLEHEAGRQYETGNAFEAIKERAWGFCAVSVYRIKPKGGE